MTTALCVSVMLVASSVFEGFQQQIAEKVFGFWGHIHITDVESNRSIEPIPLKDSKELKKLCMEYDYSSLHFAKNPIKDIEEFVLLPGILGNKDEFEGLFLKGVNSHFDWDFLKKFIKKGNKLQFNDSSFSKEIILSEQIAAKLNLNVGESLIAHFFIDNKLIKRKLQVVGIYRTGLEEYDKKFALVDIALLQQLLQWKKDEVTGLEVFTSEINRVEEINDFLYEKVLPGTVYSESIRNKYPAIFEWLALQDINKYFILGLIFLVCIINISITLLILIMTRTQMIGILSTIGMSAWDQRKIFIRYGIQIVTKGMLIGNAIGLGICLLQYHFKFIKLNEENYYLDHAPISLNPYILIFVNLIFFVVICINLIIPSYYVARINPVNALRFR
ncbi:MAG: FtsX-like permease family protein [Saprospiraceae bacterium]